MQQGKALIFSAPSGSGKTTIVKYLLRHNQNLDFSISACTRPKRPNETDGKDYYFLTPDVFKEKIRQEAFIEWEEVYPNQFYGTLKSEINRIWQNHKHVIFDVDVEGGLSLKRYFQQQALAVFVKAPSLKVIRHRLLNRKTDSLTSIIQRLEKAAHELTYEIQFDVTIVNDKLEDSCHQAQQLYEQFVK